MDADDNVLHVVLGVLGVGAGLVVPKGKWSQYVPPKGEESLVEVDDAEGDQENQGHDCRNEQRAAATKPVREEKEQGFVFYPSSPFDNRTGLEWTPRRVSSSHDR